MLKRNVATTIPPLPKFFFSTSGQPWFETAINEFELLGMKGWDKKLKGEEVPCVRTIFDRRKHAMIIPEALPTNRIKVQPNKRNGNPLPAEFETSSFLDIYDDTEEIESTKLTQKFVPKIPVEILPESSFGKMWRRPEIPSLQAIGLSEWGFEVSPNTRENEFFDEKFLPTSSDKDDAGSKSQEKSSSNNSSPPSSAETTNRGCSGRTSVKGNALKEYGGGDLKSKAYVSEDDIWEDEEVDSSPVLPFTASFGGGDDDDDVVIEVEENPKEYLPCDAASSSSSSTSVNTSTSGEDDKVDEHMAVLKLFTVSEEDRSMLNLTGMNMDARLVDNFYKLSKNDKKDKLMMKWSHDAVRRDVKGFVKTPVAIGTVLRCVVVRNNKGIDRNLYPTYFMHLEEDKRGFMKTLLMAARKRKKSTTSNYLISVDASDLSRRGPSYVGKVRSNLLGTQFIIYDAGNSPKKFHFTSLGVDLFNYRQELGIVIYESNVLGFKGPRKMKIIIPAMLGESERCECRPGMEEETIIEQTKKLTLPPSFIELRNKIPVWNNETQSFVLNFLGRVTQPSVKNFQIIHNDKEDYVVLQFGRIDEHNFTMDFRYPLTPLQAFSFVITSFDNKLACE